MGYCGLLKHVTQGIHDQVHLVDIFTTAYEVQEKVMFSFCLSVHRGEGISWPGYPLARPPARLPQPGPGCPTPPTLARPPPARTRTGHHLARPRPAPLPARIRTGHPPPLLYSLLILSTQNVTYESSVDSAPWCRSCRGTVGSSGSGWGVLRGPWGPVSGV